MNKINVTDARKDMSSFFDSVIHEKPKHSIVPMIASCVASVIICLAVFLPILIQNNKDYNSWLANQKPQQQIEQEIEDVEEDK